LLLVGLVPIEFVIGGKGPAVLRQPVERAAALFFPGFDLDDAALRGDQIQFIAFPEAELIDQRFRRLTARSNEHGLCQGIWQRPY
jgi:hypothetical protein